MKPIAPQKPQAGYEAHTTTGDLALALAIAALLTLALLHWATPCAAGHLC